jgi:hypothetical protein
MMVWEKRMGDGHRRARRIMPQASAGRARTSAMAVPIAQVGKIIFDQTKDTTENHGPFEAKKLRS